MRVCIALFVRSRSTRLENKWSRSIASYGLLELIYKRLLHAQFDNIVFSLSQDDISSPLYAYAKRLSNNLYVLGNEDNLIERALAAARSTNSEYLVRYTCDDPFKDIKALRYCISLIEANDYDVISTEYRGSGFPEGTGFQIFSTRYLRYLNQADLTKYDLEHITPAISNSDNVRFVNYQEVYGELLYPWQESVRYTVDYESDLEFINSQLSDIPLDPVDILDCNSLLRSLCGDVDIEASLTSRGSSVKELASRQDPPRLWDSKPRFTDLALKTLTSLLTSDLRGSQFESSNAKLEKLFCEKFKAKYAISSCNGTTTIITALKALGVTRGTIVAVSPLTMSAPTIAIMSLGAIPVYVDIDRYTLNMCPKSLQQIIDQYPDLAGVIFVSLYGSMKGIEDIARVCNNHNVFLVEDNAESVDPSVNDRPYRLYGDFASFSFQASKHLTCGDGGMLITNNATLYDAACLEARLGYVTSVDRHLTKKDIQQPDSIRHIRVGNNYRLSEFAAAVAYSQLRDSNFLVEQRIYTASMYHSVTRKYKHLFHDYRYMPLNEHSYWAYPLVFKRVEHLREFFSYYEQHTNYRPYCAWRLAPEEPFTSIEENQSQLKLIYEDSFERYAHCFKRTHLPVALEIRDKVVALRTNILSREQLFNELDDLDKACSSIK